MSVEKEENEVSTALFKLCLAVLAGAGIWLACCFEGEGISTACKTRLFVGEACEDGTVVWPELAGGATSVPLVTDSIFLGDFRIGVEFPDGSLSWVAGLGRSLLGAKGSFLRGRPGRRFAGDEVLPCGDSEDAGFGESRGACRVLVVGA